jgi:hypothetical protein
MLLECIICNVNPRRRSDKVGMGEEIRFKLKFETLKESSLAERPKLSLYAASVTILINLRRRDR